MRRLHWSSAVHSCAGVNRVDMSCQSHKVGAFVLAGNLLPFTRRGHLRVHCIYVRPAEWFRETGEFRKRINWSANDAISTSVSGPWIPSCSDDMA